jgi:uncharacterized protein (PEP-CTERM system associated)
MGGAGTTPQRSAWHLLGVALLSGVASAPPVFAQTGPESPTELAQNAPENPAAPGIPGTGPLANPFPATLTAPEAPNFQYESNLEGAIGALPSIGWTFTPRISAFEEYNDNIFETQNDRRYDFISLLAPGITITGDTPRLTARLNYNPIFRIYARTSSQDSVGQQAYGVAAATIIPDRFYVNARVFADEVPTNGGYGTVNFGVPTIGTTGFGTFGGSAGGTLSRSNLTQTESAGITPYVVGRFGDVGTWTTGINLTQTYSSSSRGPTLNSPAGPALNSETAEGIAQYQSGPALGRFVDIATIDGAVSSGNGVQSNATQAIADNRLGYAFSRAILVYGDFGVETLNYPNAAPPVNITDGVWGVGTTLRPNPDSQVTMEYGHFSGVTSFRALARYAVTARTVLTATYTAGITSDLQQIESQLDNTTVNPQGNPVYLNTGAPVSILNYATGINNGVNKNQTLTFTALTLLDRDTIWIGFERVVQSPVASAPGVAANVPQTSLSVSASERHEISDRLSVTGSVQGGTQTLQTFPTSQTEQFYGATVSLQYLFSDKLTGYAMYSYFNRQSDVPGVPFYNNIALVGVTRTF